MNKLIAFFESVASHPYFLVFIGVLWWNVFFAKKGRFLKGMFMGMAGGGFIVALDDEFLVRINAVLEVDFVEFPWYLYIVFGFFLDLIIDKFIFKNNNND